MTYSKISALVSNMTYSGISDIAEYFTFLIVFCIYLWQTCWSAQWVQWAHLYCGSSFNLYCWPGSKSSLKKLKGNSRKLPGDSYTLAERHILMGCSSSRLWQFKHSFSKLLGLHQCWVLWQRTLPGDPRNQQYSYHTPNTHPWPDGTPQSTKIASTTPRKPSNEHYQDFYHWLSLMLCLQMEVLPSLLKFPSEKTMT